MPAGRHADGTHRGPRLRADPAEYSAARTVVLLPAFDAVAALNAIERWRCTAILILPAMLCFVVEEQGRRPRDVSSVRLCIAGGDTVPVTLQQNFRALFGVPVRELYGMTETVPVTCIREDAPRIGSIGPAVGRSGHARGRSRRQRRGRWPGAANCRCKAWPIASATGTTRKPPRPPSTMAGCVRATSCGATPTAFSGSKGASSRSSSAAAPTFLRRKWKRPSITIPPSSKPASSACRTRCIGEKVVAFVALRDGFTAGEQELRDLVRGRIADYKTPERILFLPALPKGLTGKVQRRELRDLVATDRDQAAGAS